MSDSIIKFSSYEDTKKSLLEYHKTIIAEIGREFNFPNVAKLPFIGLRKNVELGFLCSPLIEWEYDAVFKYGKKHVFDEYYPIIVDLKRQKVIPRKFYDYSCSIIYGHIFSPLYHQNVIYSCFINFFKKPIFKSFNAQYSALEQELVVKTSAFFRKQNKYGPEQISISILDECFMTLLISGFLSPFMKFFINKNEQNALLAEKIYHEQINLLEQILNEDGNTDFCRVFFYLDMENDKMLILFALSKEKWIDFLEKTCYPY